MSTDNELAELLHSVVPEPPRLPFLPGNVRRATRRRRAIRLAGTALGLAAASAVTVLAWPGPAANPPAGGVTTGAVNPPALTCPATPPAPPDRVPRSPRTTDRGPLVPGSPTYLTLCWYPVQHVPHPGSLARHWVFDPAGAAPFIADLNGFPAPLGGAHGCAMDDGSLALLLFQYQDGYPVWVRAQPTGCRVVDNGSRYAFDIDSRLLDRINRLS